MNRETIREHFEEAIGNANLLTGVQKDGQRVIIKMNYGGLLRHNELPEELELISTEVKNGRTQQVYRVPESNESQDDTDNNTEDENMTEDNTTQDDNAEDSKPENNDSQEEE